MRHLPLAIAGDWQCVSLRRFFAPQRGAALAALMAFFQVGAYGFLSGFTGTPCIDAPGGDRLSAVTHVDVLDGDSLCAACTELVQN